MKIKITHVLIHDEYPDNDPITHLMKVQLLLPRDWLLQSSSDVDKSKKDTRRYTPFRTLYVSASVDTEYRANDEITHEHFDSIIASAVMSGSKIVKFLDVYHAPLYSWGYHECRESEKKGWIEELFR